MPWDSTQIGQSQDERSLTTTLNGTNEEARYQGRSSRGSNGRNSGEGVVHRPRCSFASIKYFINSRGGGGGGGWSTGLDVPSRPLNISSTPRGGEGVVHRPGCHLVCPKYFRLLKRGGGSTGLDVPSHPPNISWSPEPLKAGGVVKTSQFHVGTETGGRGRNPHFGRIGHHRH